MKSKEIWKDVVGYEGLYQVSSLGRVKSLTRDVWSSSNKSFSTLIGKQKKITPRGKSGYLAVGLSKNGKNTTINIHQIVAMAFLNHKPNGLNAVVNHKNHDRTDNRIENINIISMRENNWHRRGSRSSSLTGVSRRRKSSKWDSRIYINGKSYHLGKFESEVKASTAYLIALGKWGKFNYTWRLNK